MAIVFNPQAFRRNYGEAQPSGVPEFMLQAAMAKAQMDGWREAQKQRARELEIREEDRDAEIQAADAISQFRGMQQPSGPPVAGVGPTGPAMLPPKMGVDDEDAQVERIAREVTKDPRARQMFVETVRQDRQQRVVQEGLQRTRDSLQDTLLGISRTPEAAGFAQDFEMLAQELDQIQAGVDPKVAAGIIDDVGRRTAEKKKLVYEHAERERQDQGALVMLDEQMGALPEGHPMRRQLGMLRLGIELGDIDGADVVRSLNAQQMGLQEVQPGVFMDPAKWQALQVQMQREARMALEGQARIEQGTERLEQGKRGLDLREQSDAERARHNKVIEEQKEKGTVSTGARFPTSDSITREANDIYKAWQNEDDKEGKPEFNRDAAYKIAEERAMKHWERVRGERGGPVNGTPTETAKDAFLESLSPEKRAEFEKLSPEAQAIVRKQRGG